MANSKDGAARMVRNPSLRAAPHHEGQLSHLIASGLTGEPTAPVIGIAGATNMNS
jgi:hypothetical protein